MKSLFVLLCVLFSLLRDCVCVESVKISRGTEVGAICGRTFCNFKERSPIYEWRLLAHSPLLPLNCDFEIFSTQFFNKFELLECVCRSEEKNPPRCVHATGARCTRWRDLNLQPVKVVRTASKVVINGTYSSGAQQQVHKCIHVCPHQFWSFLPPPAGDGQSSEKVTTDESAARRFQRQRRDRRQLAAQRCAAGHILSDIYSFFKHSSLSSCLMLMQN
jgi:hypothetical protein